MQSGPTHLLDLLDPNKTTTPITTLNFRPKPQSSCIKEGTSTLCSDTNLESPQTTQPKQAEKAKAPAQSQPRGGDWLCLVCGNHNYSFRETCNRCQKQTKAQNFETSLGVLNNPGLRGSLMKNPLMAQRLQFNFLYSLQSEISTSADLKNEAGGKDVSLTELLKPTLNRNVVSGNQTISSYPMSSRTAFASHRPFQPQVAKLPQGFYGFHAPKSSLHQLSPNPTEPKSYLGLQARGAAQTQFHSYLGNAGPRSLTDLNNLNTNQNKINFFPSELSLWSNASNNEISPLSHFTEKARDFKKGKINSDICPGKTSQVREDIISDKNFPKQTNLTDKFKEMTLAQTSQNNSKKDLSGSRKKRKNKVNKLREPFKEVKDANKNNKKKKKSLNHGSGDRKKKKQWGRGRRRRGKLRYKQVTEESPKASRAKAEVKKRKSRENKENSSARTNKKSDQKFAPKSKFYAKPKKNTSNKKIFSRTESSDWKIKTPIKKSLTPQAILDSSLKKSQGGFSLMQSSFLDNTEFDHPSYENEMRQPKDIQSREYGSIFESQLFFDFETPKKQRNECFLQLVSSEKKRLEVEVRNMEIPEKRNRLLKLFVPSDDEDSANLCERRNSFEESIEHMESKKTDNNRGLLVNASFREFN